jgi:hypothetical protein
VSRPSFDSGVASQSLSAFYLSHVGDLHTQEEILLGVSVALHSLQATDDQGESNARYGCINEETQKKCTDWLVQHLKTSLDEIDFMLKQVKKKGGGRVKTEAPPELRTSVDPGQTIAKCAIRYEKQSIAMRHTDRWMVMDMIRLSAWLICSARAVPVAFRLRHVCSCLSNLCAVSITVGVTRDAILRLVQKFYKSMTSATRVVRPDHTGDGQKRTRYQETCISCRR